MTASEPNERAARADVLSLIQQGALRDAAQAISALGANDPEKHLLTGLVLATAGKHEQAAAILRRLTLHLVERFVANHVGELNDRSTALLGQHYFGPNPKTEGRGPGISIFSFPKSGSTFLEHILRTYTGMSVNPMTSTNDSDGVNLDMLQFEHAVRAGQIARGHLSANARCIARCVLYDLRPVFLHRNIFDCLLSYADHFRTKYYPYPFSVPEGPLATDVAIFHMAFHYVEMFASWSNLARRTTRVLTLAYEDNRRDWRAAAEKVLTHSGIPVDRARLEQAVSEAQAVAESDPTRVRYAKGGVRDQNLIAPDTKERIRGLYRIFPGVDFSPIDPNAEPAPDCAALSGVDQLATVPRSSDRYPLLRAAPRGAQASQRRP